MTYEIRVHDMTFPRFVEDIVSGKRTLAHMVASFHHIDPLPSSTDSAHRVFEEFMVGDLLLLCPRGGRDQRRRIISVISKVRLCPLEVTEADAALLAVPSATEYLERWDQLHPQLPAALRPIVWRLEWRYDLERIPEVIKRAGELVNR